MFLTLCLSRIILAFLQLFTILLELHKTFVPNNDAKNGFFCCEKVVDNVYNLVYKSLF